VAIAAKVVADIALMVLIKLKMKVNKF